MRILFLLLLIGISNLGFGQGFDFTFSKDYPTILAETQNPKSPLFIQTLLGRFQKMDTTLSDYEVLSLLIGSTSSGHYDPFKILYVERRIYALNSEKKYPEAIILADSLLNVVPLNQTALYEKAYATYKSGSTEDIKYCYWAFDVIMKAMFQSGTGLNPDESIFALGSRDARNFLEIFLGYTIKDEMEETHDAEGNLVTILTALIPNPANDTPSEVQLFFLMEPAIRAIERIEQD